MQENRSFDHYFGTLAGVAGFGNPNDSRNTSSQAIPSTSHAWTYQHESLNITVPATPGAPTTALNNNWIPLPFHLRRRRSLLYVTGYYERGDIPFHFAL